MPLNKGFSMLGHTFRNFDQAILTVKVGKNGTPESFSCHRELLSRCSAHFDHSFQQQIQTQTTSPYSKAREVSLELEDTSPDVFDAFMIWLYTGAIPHHLIEGLKEENSKEESVPTVKESKGVSSEAKSEDDDGVDMTSWDINLDSNDETLAKDPSVDRTTPESCSAPEKAIGEGAKVVPSVPTRSTVEKPDFPKETLCPCCARPYKWRSLEGFLERRFIALFIFAHRYDIPALRRAVVIAWQTNDEILQSMPDHSNVITAYDSLPPTSSLCQYFLDMYSVYWNPDKDDERTIALRSQLPQAFLFELAVVLARGERPKMEREWCEFHEHEDEEEKKKCREELVQDPACAKALKRIRDSKSWKGLVLKKGKR